MRLDLFYICYTKIAGVDGLKSQLLIGRLEISSISNCNASKYEI